METTRDYPNLSLLEAVRQRRSEVEYEQRELDPGVQINVRVPPDVAAVLTKVGEQLALGSRTAAARWLLLEALPEVAAELGIGDSLANDGDQKEP